MKRPRYTEKELLHIRLLFEQGKSDSEIAAIMGRTEIGVRLKRQKLRLFRPDCVAMTVEKSKWNKEMELFITNYWKDLTDLQMARKLGVTRQAYKRKRQRMGFFKYDEQRKDRRRTWTFTEELFMIENHGKLTAKQIGKHLGRHYTAINTKAMRMGITKKVSQ